ncbi:MAG: YfhO family protein [Gemmatimonadota bacterium]|nr:YfhO family protein [Gemmatimonadota bacterium]
MSESTTRERELPVVWLFLAGAAAVTLWFYRDFVLDPERLIFGSDMLLEGFPLRGFYVDEVRAGRGVPLWTPHVYGGMPYVALLPGPIFYPSTLLYFLMPLYRAIGWTFVLHTFLGAAFAYFMARSFRLRPWSAAVCGTSFMLTGYITSHLFGGQDGRMFAMALVPLAFGLLERGLRGGELRWFAGLALVVGAQIFTPHTQVMYFSSLALTAYVAWHLAVRVRTEEGGGARFVRPAALAAGAFVLAAAVGAVQLLPTFELLPHVTRQATETGYAFAASYALPPQELTALFLPDLIGSLPQIYWGSNGIKLHTEYMGAVPIALALFAIAVAARGGLDRDGRRVVWFLAGGSVLGILFALGSATPVHRIAYAIVPMIASFRAPAMMMCAVVTFVALLAGFGWEAVLRAREDEEGLRISWVWLAVLGAPILLFALAGAVNPEGLMRWALLGWYPEGWPRQPSPGLAASLGITGLIVVAGFGLAWGIALAVARRRVGELAVLVLLAFTVFDLARVGGRYLSTEPAEAWLAADPIIETLREEAAPGERVWAIQREQPMYRPNAFMYYGLSSATGSQKFVLDPYARLVGAVGIDDVLLQLGGVLAPLLDARWLITRTEQPEGPLELRARHPDGRLLYRLRSDVPHAFFPASIDAVSSAEEAVDRTRGNLDPLGTAVVETSGSPPPAGAGTAAIVSYEPDEVVLDVTAERGGLLAVSEIHHPGWRARVDDADVPIARVNGAFRGIEVPAGSHTVRFEFHSAGYTAGLWLTVLSSIGLVGFLVVSGLRARSVPAADPAT